VIVVTSITNVKPFLSHKAHNLKTGADLGLFSPQPDQFRLRSMRCRVTTNTG